MKFLLISLVVLGCGFLFPAPLVDSAHILAVYPSFIRSHLTVAEGILEQLAENGHQVTLISAFRFHNRRDNMDRKTEIHLDGLKSYIQENTMSKMFTEHTSAVEDVSKFIYAAAEIVNYTMNDEKVQTLLQSPEAHFDLVLVDHFLNDAFLGFGLRFKAPVVLTSSTVINKWIERSVGNPHNPAYNPHLFLGYTSQMSFWQRIINVVVSICEDFSYNLLYLPVQQSMYQRFFGRYINDPLPPLEDLIHNVSFALVNSDRVFHGARAFLPNVFEIGGAHVANAPPKPLPKDINHYFSIADDGIFLMTLGASTKPSTILSKDKLAAINHVLRRIPTSATFVRWDNGLMDYQSDNVVIGQWIPQADMLADPQVRLLITNGGLLSIYEAIYYKKPIIGMPLFGDQFQNIALVERHKIGRTLNVDNITIESFDEVLTDVRTNPIYQENIDNLHRLMFGGASSSPEDKLQQAVAHIEYVLETKGAAHLKSPALSLSVWQVYLVDVSATLILMLFVILAVPAAVIGIILRRANPRNVDQRTTRSWNSSDDVKQSPKTSAATTPTEEERSSGSGSGSWGIGKSTVKKRN